MGKSLFDSILDSIFDNKWVGAYGEALTAFNLQIVKLFGRKGKILQNIYIPKDDGTTSEIDVVYITQKGIFVFESKNYSGWIFGNEKQQNWTAMLPNKQKNRFYNPIMQNNTHLKWMRKYLGEDIPLFSIIVFSERCELKKVTITSDNVKVIQRDRVYATVREIWESHEDLLSEEKIAQTYDRLQQRTNVSESVRSSHIENIKHPYKKTEQTSPEKNTAAQEESETPICPQCGSKLVLRTAMKGANAGNQFYGCSAYPKCRFIKNIEPSLESVGRKSSSGQ